MQNWLPIISSYKFFLRRMVVFQIMKQVKEAYLKKGTEYYQNSHSSTPAATHWVQPTLETQHTHTHMEAFGWYHIKGEAIQRTCAHTPTLKLSFFTHILATMAINLCDS